MLEAKLKIVFVGVYVGWGEGVEHVWRGGGWGWGVDVCREVKGV